MREKRLQEWVEKTLYGQYLRQIKEVKIEQLRLTSEWRLEKTESLIVATQNQIIRRNAVEV